MTTFPFQKSNLDLVLKIGQFQFLMLNHQYFMSKIRLLVGKLAFNTKSTCFQRSVPDGTAFATCGSQTHTEVIACDYMLNLLTTRPLWTYLCQQVGCKNIYQVTAEIHTTGAYFPGVYVLL